MRVSALDLYVHELVAQEMLSIFDGIRAPTPGYLRFQLSNETLHRIRTSTSLSGASAAFDLDVRSQLAFITYQDPEKIADGVRLISTIELWNEIALKRGATSSTKSTIAKNLKKDISLIVQRRNKIAHEGDLQPMLPRDPWPITHGDLVWVTGIIEGIVKDIDAIV